MKEKKRKQLDQTSLVPQAATIYKPGPTLEEISHISGIPSDEVVKLSSNENPLGPSIAAISALQKEAKCIHQYPDSKAKALRKALASYLGLTTDHIITGAGSSELMGIIIRCFSSPGDEVLSLNPGFTLYSEIAETERRQSHRIPLTQKGQLTLEKVLNLVTAQTRIIFITRPNNPTSSLVPLDLVAKVAHTLSKTIVVSDEAYIEFADDFPAVSAIKLVENTPNLIVLRTFSKAFGLASIRLGYAAAPTDIIEVLSRLKPKWNTSGVAQKAGIAAVKDLNHLSRTRDTVIKGRRQLIRGLQRLPKVETPIPNPQGNFVYVDISKTENSAYEIETVLIHKGIAIRGDFSTTHIRVSVGLPDQNERLLQVLKHYIKGKPKARSSLLN